MPDIDRQKLSAKLNTIPEHDREPYLAALKAKGYTWAASAALPKNVAGQTIYPAVKEISKLDAAKETAAEMNPLGPEATAFLRREAPPTVGGMVGAALGGAAGAAAGGVGAPAGAVAGAALGGMAGRAYGKIVDYLSGHADPQNDSPMGNAGDILGAGLAQALGEGAGQAAGEVMRLGKPHLVKVGAQIIKASTGIPEKYGEAVLRNPAILNVAHRSEDMGRAYEAFERYAGLQSLGKKMVADGRAHIPPTELEKMIVGTAKKVFAQNAAAKAAGTGAEVALAGVARGGAEKVSAQELYEASQAASHLNLAAKYGEPSAQQMMASGIIKQSKQTAEDALQEIYPEYRNLRQANFHSKAREAFAAVLPQNKNFTPSVLRTGAALSAAGYEVERGHPLRAALIAGMVSPGATGLAIRAASAAAPVAVSATSLATRAAAQATADKLGARMDPTALSPEAQKVLGVTP